MGSEKSARYAYELDPQCQRGGNNSMDQQIRVCHLPGVKHGHGVKSARAYELMSKKRQR